jgi:hypothetical protein
MGTVSRMPQTTTQPGGGEVPFSRLSRQMQILGPSQAGLAFGSLWTPILKPVGGYVRYLDLTITSAGSTLTGGALGTSDFPYSCIQNLFLRDPFGQPIIQADGYSLFLINVYGGQAGMLGFGNNPATMPSFSSTVASGNFVFSLDIPLELDSSGYCSLPSMNASSQPQLQVQFNTLAATYTNGTTPTTGTSPTLTTTANEPFWGAPVDRPEVAPPDVGSSGQWSVARAQSTVLSASFQRIVLPRVGTWVHTLILVLRDSTGARIDQWPSTDLQLWVDGVPVLFESLTERTDNMYRQFGVTRPTGVICYTFRNSVQHAVSFADTYDLLLPTTPATLLEVAGTFGTISNAPATIQAITGELFPVGGIPYTHLAS